MCGRVFSAGGGLDGIYMMSEDKYTQFGKIASTILQIPIHTVPNFGGNGAHNVYYERTRANLTGKTKEDFDALVGTFDHMRGKLKSTAVELGARISRSRLDRDDRGRVYGEGVSMAALEAWTTLTAAKLNMTPTVYACGLVGLDGAPFNLQISEHGQVLSDVLQRGDEYRDKYSQALETCLNDTSMKRLLITDNKPTNLVIVRDEVKIIDLDPTYTVWLTEEYSVQCIYYINAAILLIYAKRWSTRATQDLLKVVKARVEDMNQSLPDSLLRSSLCNILFDPGIDHLLDGILENAKGASAHSLAGHVIGMIAHYLKEGEDPWFGLRQSRGLNYDEPILQQLVTKALVQLGGSSP